MSTLVQIESAVAGLPAQEQWTLLTWLQDQLKTVPKPPETKGAASSAHQEWLADLERLRAQTNTGRQGIPQQELMDEIREDRC